MRRLLKLAKRMGTSVRRADLGPDCDGVYFHERRTAWINDDLDADRSMVTLAHELGHAFYQHEDTDADAEDAADEFAIRCLELMGYDRLAAMVSHPTNHVRDLVLGRDTDPATAPIPFPRP